MAFVELSLPNGDRIQVNSALVTVVRQAGDGSEVFVVGHEAPFRVSGSTSAVVRLISGGR